MPSTAPTTSSTGNVESQTGVVMKGAILKRGEDVRNALPSRTSAPASAR